MSPLSSRQRRKEEINTKTEQKEDKPKTKLYKNKETDNEKEN